MTQSVKATSTLPRTCTAGTNTHALSLHSL